MQKMLTGINSFNPANMKYLISTTLVLIVLISCNKETEDVPDYLPGRLIEISHEAFSLGLVYHKFEYADDKITDLYRFNSPQTFISKYNFKYNLLSKVYFSFENTNEEYFGRDSLIYNYSDSFIIETNYFNNESHKEIYELENGKIISSSWKTDDLRRFVDHYYEWSGNNLIRCEKQFWLHTRPTPIITEYVYEYSNIENPFYFNNIPRIMKEFSNPYNNFDELTDLIPKCSENFPVKLTIKDSLYEGRTIFKSYDFECKTFPNTNKPYEVKMLTIKNDGSYGRQVDYFFTYEEL